MAKNQEARKRKHNSRNGSSGRGNGVDTAKLNGKAKPKTVDETPGWQKTLGALVIITGVIAAAFMTGVIRIDRNIDNDAEQNHTQEANSNVADIKDSKSNKTTVLFTQTEHNNLTSETPESDLKTEHHRDEDKKSNSDTEIDNKKVINSESRAHAPLQRFTESDADMTKEVSDVEEKEDKLDFQAEAAFGAKRDILEERVDEEKQPVPAPGNLKTEDPAKSFTGKGATVTETDFPKGKMVTPKRTPRSTENTKESKSKPPGKADEGSLKHADVLRPPKPQETLQVEETAPDRLESKSGGEQDVPSLIELGEAAERKIGKADSVRPSPPKEMKQPEKTRTESKDHQTKDRKKAKVSPRKVDGVHPPAPLEVRSSPRKDDSVKPPPPVEKDMKKQSSRKSDDVNPPLPQKGRERLEESPRKTSRVRPPPPVVDGEGVKKYARKAVSVSPLPPQEERGKSKEPPRKTDGGRTPPPLETRQREEERIMGNSDQARDRKSDSPPPPPPPAQETTQPEAERAIGNSDQARDRKSDSPPPPPPPAQETTQPEAERAMGNSDQATDRKSDRPPPPPAQETTQPEAERAMGTSDQATDRKSDRPPPPPPPAQEKTQPEAERAMGNSDQAKERKSDNTPPPPPPAQETPQPEAERAMRNSDQAKDLKSKSPPPPAQETTQPEADRAIKKEEQPVDRSDASKVRENISIKAENKKPIQKSALETLLEETEGLIQKNKKDQALYKYEDIIKRFPNSAKALMAKAQLLDMLAEERRSNDLLDGAIQSYRQAADAPHCPRDIKRAALARMGDRLSFFGKSSRSIQVYLELVKEFPDDYEAKKSLAVQYLIAGKNKRAKHYFEKMVERNPTDGFALVHLGFILKSEENYLEAIPLLRAGIDTGDRETNEGKFFFHLGESFLRTGQIEESYKIYDEAVSRGHFRSRYQRSLYNVDSLRGRQFWTPREAGFAEAAKILESNWETIRDEAVALLSTDGFFRNEEEKLRETGDWKQFTLFAKGSKDQGNCRQAPRTCEIFDSIPQSKNCRRGQVKFSVMHPGTHVWPHCGPTNCRLRSHLGLIIPQPVRLRVGNSTRTWEEGKLFIFDDSFEHEVWQEADSLRLILIADLWHPDLTESEKRKLTPI